VNRVSWNIAANLVGKMWQAVMSIAFVPMYIKFLGIEAYGLMAIYGSLSGVMGLLDLGLSTTLNHELAKLSAGRNNEQRMRNFIRTLEVPYWTIALLITGFALLLSGPIATYWIKSTTFPPSKIRSVVTIIGIVIAIRWPVNLYSGGIMGLQKQVALNAINMAIDTIRGVGSVIVLWKVSATIEAFFIFQIIVSSVHVTTVAAFLWISVPKAPDHARIDLQLLKEVRRFAGGLTGIAITSVILTQSDKIILSKFLSLRMFGYYSLATVVVNSLYFMIGPVYTAVFPALSRLSHAHDNAGLVAFYHKGSQALAVLLIPTAVILALFAKETIFLWTTSTETTLNTSGIVGILVVGTTVNGIMNMPFALQIANDWPGLSLLTNTAFCIVQVPLIYFLSINFGVFGAASSWVVLNAATAFITIHLMHKRLLPGEKRRWVVHDNLIPLLASTGSALCWKFYPHETFSRGESAIFLAGASASTMTAAIFSAPYVRTLVLENLHRWTSRRLRAA
jgi:O-antigen/teichoic acid export membrane protein